MKCAIYPYSDALYPILENADYLIDKISICAVVYPFTWRKLLFHKSVLEGVASGWDFEKLISNAECVIFADVTDKEIMYPDILEKAEISLTAGKDIIFCTDVNEQDIAELRKKYPDRNISIKYDNTGNVGVNVFKHEDISCAAIGIGGLYRGLDETAAVAGISAEFRKTEFRTVTIATNATMSLLGFYQFPSKIFSSRLDIEQQAGALNAFFRAVELKTKCDIMIVQFPDGMMKFMPETRDAYGVKAFMLTRAVAFDYFILGSFMEITNQKAYECVRSLIEKRFDLSLDACLFHPLAVDREYSAERQRILYTGNNIEKLNDDYEKLKQDMQDIIIADYDDHEAYVTISKDFINKLT